MNAWLIALKRDTGRDLEAMINFDDVTILEAMGRNAGWLAAASALGKEDDDSATLVWTGSGPVPESVELPPASDG